MATNVTEKDKTLQQIIAWCDRPSTEIKCTEDATTDRTYGKLRGLYLVYEHCQNMLGHSVPCTAEWLEAERRKAWQEGYAAGWKDQECDFPPHTTENPYKETNKIGKDGE